MAMAKSYKEIERISLGMMPHLRSMGTAVSTPQQSSGTFGKKLKRMIMAPVDYLIEKDKKVQEAKMKRIRKLEGYKQVQRK